MYFFIGFSYCLTMQNNDSLWLGNFIKKNEKYIFNNIIIQDINVKDAAAICLLAESSNVEADSCQCKNIVSNSGSCCFNLEVNASKLHNCCFSNLKPDYQVGSYYGGACTLIRESTFIDIENFAISSAIKYLGVQPYAFATLAFYNSICLIKNVNQTDCRCYYGSDYACGFYFDGSSNTEKFIYNSNMYGDTVTRYRNHKTSSKADNIGFNNCTVRVGLIMYSAAKDIVLNMTSCIVKECKGSALSYEGSVIMEGWYCDTQLPAIFENTVRNEFSIPLSPITCNLGYGGKTQEALMVKMCIGIFLENSLNKI